MDWSVGGRVKRRAQSRAEVIQKRKVMESAACSSSPGISAATKRPRRRRTKADGGIEFLGSIDSSGKFTPFVESKLKEKEEKPVEQKASGSDLGNSGLGKIKLKAKEVKSVEQNLSGKDFGKSGLEKIKRVQIEDEPVEQNASGLDLGKSGLEKIKTKEKEEKPVEQNASGSDLGKSSSEKIKPKAKEVKSAEQNVSGKDLGKSGLEKIKLVEIEDKPLEQNASGLDLGKSGLETIKLKEKEENPMEQNISGSHLGKSSSEKIKLKAKEVKSLEQNVSGKDLGKLGLEKIRLVEIEDELFEQSASGLDLGKSGLEKIKPKEKAENPMEQNISGSNLGKLGSEKKKLKEKEENPTKQNASGLDLGKSGLETIKLKEKEDNPTEQNFSGSDVGKWRSETIVLIDSDSEPEKGTDDKGPGGVEALGIGLGPLGSTSEDKPSESEEEDDDEDDKDYKIQESESDQSPKNSISSTSSSDDEEGENGGLLKTIGDTDYSGFKKDQKTKKPEGDSSVSSKTGENEAKKVAQMKRKCSQKSKEVSSQARKPRKYEKKMKQKYQKNTREFGCKEEGRTTTAGDRNDENEGEQQFEMEFLCPCCGKISKGASKSDSIGRERAEDNVPNSSECRSQKPFENGSEKEKEAEAKNSSGWRVLGGPKELDVFGLLANSIWEEKRIEEADDPAPVSSPPKEESQEHNNEEEYDENGLLVIKPPPLTLNFGWKEPEPPLISESEREEEKLWAEMALCLKLIEIGSDSSPDIVENEEPQNQATLCREGKHELFLDLEIGLKCIHCGFIETEIRHVDVSEWATKNTNARNKTDRREEKDGTLFEKLGFQVPDTNSSTGSHSSEGTVWDAIPGTRRNMYAHQQDGFEFVWRNLAGTVALNELKSFETSDETGGCIISHAPGTGKTRLTIVFLQSYIELFPDCRPVIIAPASLLLTWEEEFKKWNMNVPFHNLNNLEFSGKENPGAVKIMEERGLRSGIKNETRMVKLFSWSKSKSVLGISYNLYEKLAGEKIDKGRKKKTNMKLEKKQEEFRKILLEMPGLLVLDEAHTPRNQRSCIWKTLLKVKTQKRILLSGTPFQNNFLELCNVLCLARPAYLEMLSSMLKKRKMKNVQRKTGRYASFGSSADEINNDGIEELKHLMEPFVHVHKGSILQKNLPGLRDCVVVLNPPDLQKKVLEAIDISQTLFDVEHKLSVVSIHPSLLLCCSLSVKERSALTQPLLEQLQKLRLEANQSVKTRFLMEFIRLCDVINEKVLVFSQFIDPLSLIMEQLSSLFNWLEGKEVFYMHGKLDQKQRQCLINKFNDPRSEAKVILASTKACSEGINLVGASRVVLLDVVWNPSVERQAISRAYRIGQKRIVYTYHLVTKGTPECQKYCKQAEKHRISELVFSSGNDKGKVKSSESVIAEDKVMEEMVQHVRLQDMFEKLIYQPKEADLVEGFNSIAA